ncbi:hypothetical protein [Burkholderia territorii]|uniref:hypothetical protein n=1 Tax=Burkholderia territorii TaxID=1503055 RepID=UPI0012D97238|nr:hypothetical protein [Burkholderia territorii]
MGGNRRPRGRVAAGYGKAEHGKSAAGHAYVGEANANKYKYRTRTSINKYHYYFGRIFGFFNADSSEHVLLKVEHIRALSRQIVAHTETVSSAIRANIDRWRLK